MADKIWLDIIYVDMIRLQSNESLNQLVQRIIFYFLSLLVVTQIRGHTAGSSSPPIHYGSCLASVSYTHLRAHETRGNLVCRLLLEKKNK